MSVDRAPAITIIVTTYNYGRFLAEAIESALAQTHPPLEVIVVDDGSTDDSVAIAARYPIRLIHQENSGVACARNRGARAAKGELLVFLDADDVLEPTYLARCCEALARAPSHVAYAYTQMRLFGTEEGVFTSYPFTAEKLRIGNYVPVSALVRRACFDAVGGFDPSWSLGYEDYELWVRLLDAGWHGVFVEAPLLRYRRHARSRNTLAPEALRRLEWRLRWSYPRMFWRELRREPREAIEALLDDVARRLRARGRRRPVAR